MAEVSQLRPYSVGIVAANKLLKSKEIEVTPIEDTQLMHGEITDDPFRYKAKGTDAAKGAYQLDVMETQTVIATWLPMGSPNRLTAPDVRRGMRVLLWRFADEDKFFWTTLHDDMDLRKLETVIFAWSDTKKEDEPISPENSYWLEISTHRSLVNFSTAKTNEEQFAYNLQLNAHKDHSFVKLEDDDGQFIILDSKNRQIIAQNKDTSRVDINQRNIYINAPDLVDIRGRTVDVTAQNWNLKAGNSNNYSNKEVTSASERQIFANTNHYGNHMTDGKIGGTTGFTAGSSNGSGRPIGQMESTAVANVEGGHSLSLGDSSGVNHIPGGTQTTTTTTGAELDGESYNVGYTVPGEVFDRSGQEHNDPIIDVDYESRTVQILAKKFVNESVDVEERFKDKKTQSLTDNNETTDLINKSTTDTNTTETLTLTAKNSTTTIEQLWKLTAANIEIVGGTEYKLTTPKTTHHSQLINYSADDVNGEFNIQHRVHVHGWLGVDGYFYSSNYGQYAFGELYSQVQGLAGQVDPVAIQAAIDAATNAMQTTINDLLARVHALENP